MNRQENSGIGIYNSSLCATGLERNTVQLVKALHKRGNRVCLFVPSNSYSDHLAAEAGIPTSNCEESRRYMNLGIARRLAYVLKTQGYRTLLIARPRDIVTGVLVKLFYFKQIQLVFYQQIKLVLHQNRRLYSILFSRFDKWFIIGEHMRKQVMRYSGLGTDRIIYLPPCGGDAVRSGSVSGQDARKSLGLSEGKFIIGASHRFTPANHLDFLIRAVQFLRHNQYDIELVLCGSMKSPSEHEYGEFLKELTRECKLSSSVHFRENFTNTRVFLQAIDVFVQSRICQPYSKKIIEALFAGVPVVTPFSENSNELLQHGKIGMLYQRGDIEDFAARLVRLINQPMIGEHISMESSDAAGKRFSTDAICKIIEYHLGSE